jgi:hypothetical protein
MVHDVIVLIATNRRQIQQRFGLTITVYVSAHCDGHNFALLMLFRRCGFHYAVAMDWTLGFFIPQRSQQAMLSLEPGRPLRLSRARGRVVLCECGCVWITAPGEVDDVFLHAGC